MANRQAILGKKIGMTQLFNETGEAISVTVIEAGPCYVTQLKTQTSDGYNAIQIGFGHAKHLGKAAGGHLGDRPALRYLHEIRTDDVDQYQLGQVISVSLFAPGELVDVVATSKGRGFAGGVKRYHFKGGHKTRGASDRVRAVGAIGSGTTPGRVWKGLRGPGHMGDHRVSVLNLEVIKVDPERNLLAVHGSVPGAANGLVFVRKAKKTQVARKRRALQG